jgi:hypothetical protein
MSGDVDERVSLDKDWRGHVIGSPPLDFATLRRRNRQKGATFSLRSASLESEAPEVNEGGTLLIIRSNGDLAFVSEELPAIEAGMNDQRIQIKL